MPTINLNINKQKYVEKRPLKINDNKIAASKIYNSKQWKYLRNSYLSEHPLCEDCLQEGIIKPAAEVHHIQPILTATTPGDMEALAFNPSNLRSLCVYHHKLVHKKMRK